MSAALNVAIAGGPYALAAGPDGAMWVTLMHAGAIARVTNGGDVTVYPIGPQSRPSIITAGPDGARDCVEQHYNESGTTGSATQ